MPVWRLRPVALTALEWGLSGTLHSATEGVDSSEICRHGRTWEAEIVNDHLIGMRAVAERLGVSVWTARQMLRDGRLPAIKIGPRTFRVAESALAAFIERSTASIQRGA